MQLHVYCMCAIHTTVCKLHIINYVYTCASVLVGVKHPMVFLECEPYIVGMYAYSTIYLSIISQVHVGVHEQMVHISVVNMRSQGEGDGGGGERW